MNEKEYEDKLFWLCGIEGTSWKDLMVYDNEELIPGYYSIRILVKTIGFEDSRATSRNWNKENTLNG